MFGNNDFLNKETTSELRIFQEKTINNVDFRRTSKNCSRAVLMRLSPNKDKEQDRSGQEVQQQLTKQRSENGS